MTDLHRLRREGRPPLWLDSTQVVVLAILARAWEVNEEEGWTEGPVLWTDDPDLGAVLDRVQLRRVLGSLTLHELVERRVIDGVECWVPTFEGVEAGHLAWDSMPTAVAADVLR